MLPQVVRRALRSPGDPLNVLLFRSEDDIDRNLCRGAASGSRFFAYAMTDERPWNYDKLVPPENLTFLDHSLDTNQVPRDVVFDLVVTPWRPAVLTGARSIAATLHVPLVTLVVDPPSRSLAPRPVEGHLRIYPTTDARLAWEDNGDEAVVAPRWDARILGELLETTIARHSVYDQRWSPFA